MDNPAFIKKDPFGQQYNMHELEAYKKGYRYIDGDVVSPYGRRLKLSLTTTGYLKFSIRTGSRSDGTSKKKTVLVHRLVAHQKYGDRIYSRCVVRHLDGVCTNNDPGNVVLGSQLQNIMDINPADRRYKSLVAAKAQRRFSDSEIRKIRAEHHSYKETMEKWGISSKGTLHHILNHEYSTRMAG
jgi:hypothetical protein